MTDPHTVTDESDSEDIGDVFPVIADIRDEYVGEGGDGTDPTLPEVIPDPVPNPGDDEEGEDSE
jgi:hypothetical protein